MSALFLRGRVRARQASELAKAVKSPEPPVFGSKSVETLSKSERSELMRKLKIDQKKL